MGDALDPGQVRRLAEEHLGGWNAIWAHEFDVHPEYLRAIAELHAVPERAGALDPATRALIRLALDAAVSHLHVDGARRAIREALEAGASSEEIFEVLMVTSTLGVHGMHADALAAVLLERGIPTADAELSDRQRQIRDEYTRVRGYWRDFLDDTLRLAPDFLAAYLDFSGAPWRHGVLAPKVREFIYLAFDASPTHMHLTGLRLHMHNALDHGATPEEIVEIMALAAAMGLQSLEVGVPILDEETRARG